MNWAKKAGNLIFNSLVSEGVGRMRAMDVNLIVMSHETAREIAREDWHGACWHQSRIKTDPDRIYNRRVAYDDSMGLGEMLVAEAKGDLG